MQIIDRPTDRKILNAMMPNYFGDMVKAVVDIAQNKIGVDAEPCPASPEINCAKLRLTRI